MPPVNTTDIPPRYLHPLITPKPAETESKTNRLKTVAIITAIVGGILAALAGLCYTGTFPPELLGGTIGSGICFTIGSAIVAPSAYFIYKYW